MPNITFICYGQQLTGSVNIRGYNKKWGDSVYQADNLSDFGDYCKKYDLEIGKKEEPFFDYIAARIMTLDKTTFNQNFRYVPVTLSRENISVNSGKSANNSIKTTPFTIFKDTTYTKFRAITGSGEYERFNGYEKSKHIFIGGPITDESLKVITGAINNKNLTNPHLYIHFQGESPTNTNGDPAIENTAYQNPKGIFANAFNIQNSIYNYSRFRDLLKEYNVSTYTVIPSSDHLINNNESGGIKKNTIKWNGVPTLYIKFYKEIEHEVLLKTKPNITNSIKLNIIQIHQDIYDKDNYPSLMHLYRYSTNQNAIQYFISGVPIFESKGEYEQGAKKYGLGLERKNGYNILDTTYHIHIFWNMWRSWSGNTLPLIPNDISIVKYYKTNKENKNVNVIKPSAFHPNIFLSGKFYTLIGFKTIEDYKQKKMFNQVSSIEKKYETYSKNPSQYTNVNKIAIQKKLDLIQHALQKNNSHHLNNTQMQTAINYNLLNIFKSVKELRKMHTNVVKIQNALKQLKIMKSRQLPSRSSSKTI